jgi:hypothetical protein
MAQKTVLAINFTKERLQQLKPLALLVKAPVRPVGEEEKACTIGQVMGLSPQEIAAIENLKPTAAEVAEEQKETAGDSIVIEEPVTQEAIVLCGFENKDVHTLLDAIRGSRLKSVPLKAMLTPHNISWTVQYMLTELAKEYAYFRQKR